MSKIQVLAIVTAGVIEFIGGIAVILMLSESQRGNINLGIGTSISTLYTVFASGLSYMFFRERVNIAQLIGIFVVIAACAVISLTGEDNSGKSDSTATVGSSTGSMVKVVFYAILTAVTVACESTIT